MLLHPSAASRRSAASSSRPARLRRLLLALALLGLSALGQAASANTLNVPSTFPTIQAAITASADGDTVLLSDGTYTGSGNVDVDFGGHNVTVTSQNGAAKTIIDCGGSLSGDGSGDHRGFYLHSGEQSAVISGLTIQKGYESGSNGSDGNGGGIQVSAANVTVQNCVLQNNTAQEGGGLYSGGYFGGTLTLTNCALVGNSAQQGGGLFNLVTARLTNCALEGNTANAGGGLYNASGGFYPGTARLTNCTLGGNTGQGGGLYNDGVATLTNDVLYGDGGSEIAVKQGLATISYCDVQGGYAGTGNLDADPRFVSATDLHLLAGSLCLGAGTGSGAPATTLDGYPRPSPPSIGAYELDRRATTTTALTSSLNPSLAGQALAFTAGVTGAAGTPTGSVTFTVDGNAQTPVAVDGSGNATFPTSALAVGTHTLTASYGGDAADTPSASGTLTQTVNQATPTVAVTSSLNPSAVGQSVTFTAAVTGSRPTGSVTILVDSTQTSALLDSSGHATLTTSALSAGQHSVTASYDGDASNAASTSDTLTQTVSPATAATALTLRDVTGSPGQTVNLRAALATTAGAALPGQTVTFSIDGTAVAGGLTNNGGVRVTAYALPATLALGPHALTAAFSGDANNAPSTGAATLTVVLPAVKVAVSAVGSAAGTPGQTVTLRAGLHRVVGGAAVAGETATFSVDGMTVGTAITNAAGLAALPYLIPAGDAPGAHPITATFAGDASYSAAAGANTLTVRLATSLSVPGASGPRGTGVTLTAVLTAGGAASSGKTVSFKVDGKAVGTAVTDGAGTASLPYAIPAASKPGGHPVSASFAGDAGNAPATGAGTLTVR